MPIQITINPYFIHYVNKTNTVLVFAPCKKKSVLSNLRLPFIYN